MAKDDLCWRAATGARGVPQLQQSLMQPLIVDGAVGRRFGDEVLDGLHRSFSMPVRLGVVWRGEDVDHAPPLEEGGDFPALELRATVCAKPYWYAECDEHLSQSLDDLPTGCVSSWELEDHWPVGESVHTDQEVSSRKCEDVGRQILEDSGWWRFQHGSGGRLGRRSWQASHAPTVLVMSLLMPGHQTV